MSLDLKLTFELLISSANFSSYQHLCTGQKLYKTLLLLSELSEALEKMKGVYEHNPQMGDPTSLEPQITETTQNIGRLRGELAKYEVITTNMYLHMLIPTYIQ